MPLNQDFYQFIQKTSDESDPRYNPYLEHTTSYIANIILLGNTIVLLIITILLKDKQMPPKHSMLGNLVRDYSEALPRLIHKNLILKILEFNNVLNLVKHSVIVMSPDNINDPYTILFLDLKEQQIVTIPINKQQESISSAQGIIANLKV